MRQHIRSGLRRFGFELKHRADDPVLAELRPVHEVLRLQPYNRLLWNDSFPKTASHANLRHLLKLHQIDFEINFAANRGQIARHCRRLA